DAGRGGLSLVALRTMVEQAVVAAAPDAGSIEIEAPETAAGTVFVPVEQVRMRSAAREGRR
ncbi:MAG: hypothetical protein ACREJG_10350, partial [Candidatus Rokuibacteriota bacterium]